MYGDMFPSGGCLAGALVLVVIGAIAVIAGIVFIAWYLSTHLAWV